MTAPESSASVSELQAHGSALVDRAARGDRITITCNGKPKALLVPLGVELDEDGAALLEEAEQAFGRFAAHFARRQDQKEADRG